MQLVDLADEFHLTTADALDLCLAAGITAESAETELTPEQGAQWHALAEEQRTWKAEAAAAAAEAKAFVVSPSGQGPSASFASLSPAPWDTSARGTAGDALGDGTDGFPALGPAWDEAVDGPRPTQVSLYAAAALAFAVIGLFFPFLPVLIAIPIALAAKRQIQRSGGGLTGDRLARAALAISAVAIVVWVAIIGVGLYRQIDHQRSLTQFADIQVNTDTVAWDQIGVGDCVRIPRADVPVEDWQGLDCNAPHEAEVFATGTVNRRVGEPYPGRESFIPLAEEQCKAEFVRYVGVPFDQSELRMGVYFPTVRNWTSENDRGYGCIVYQDTYALINGSLQNAKR
jgi:Septum formation